MSEQDDIPETEPLDWEEQFKSTSQGLFAALTLIFALYFLMMFYLNLVSGSFDKNPGGFVVYLLLVLFWFWVVLFFLSPVRAIMNQRGFYYFGNRILFINRSRGYRWEKVCKVRTIRPWGRKSGEAKLIVEGRTGVLVFHTPRFRSEQLKSMFGNILGMLDNYPHIRIEDGCKWHRFFDWEPPRRKI